MKKQAIKRKAQTSYFRSESQRKGTGRTSLLFGSKTIMVLAIAAVFISGTIAAVILQQSRQSNALVNGLPPYDPLALFNQPIPDNHPTDPNSPAIISRISTDFNRVAFTHTGEVPTVYQVNDSMPRYTVTWAYGGNVSFPVSADVQAGGGADHPLVLLNTDSQVELRLWQAVVNHSTKQITASYGGQFYFNNDGRILNPNGTRSTSIPFSGVGTGSGLSYLAGLVTNEDFDSGVIRHAIRFANSCSTSTATYRPPATKTDQPHPGCGAATNPNAASSIEMGSILQLDKNIDCNARTVPGKTATSKETRLLRMVCKAMQDYGMIMLDGSPPGGSANFYLEDNRTAQWNLDDRGYGNYGWMFRPPYYSGDGVSRNGSTDGIPFNKFRVTARPASNTSWGAETPTTPPTTPPAPVTTKPAAPTGLKLSASDGKLVATWNASPSTENVTSYQVYLNDSTNFSSAASPTYTITGSPGQTFSVRVSAQNSSGYGPWSDPVSGTIPTASPTPATGTFNANDWSKWTFWETAPTSITRSVTKSNSGRLLVQFNGNTSGYKGGQHGNWCLERPSGSAQPKSITFTASYNAKKGNTVYFYLDQSSNKKWQASDTQGKTVTKTITVATGDNKNYCFGNKAIDNLGSNTYSANRFINVTSYKFNY